MEIRTAIIKAGAKFRSAQVVIQLCSFIRNIIIARLIGPANFGIAAMLAVTLSVVEMVSNLAAEKLIIQSEEGEEVEFQGTIHLTQFIRGCFASSMLLMIAGPTAILFGVVDATWAFRWVACIPFIRGFIHKDISRFQQNLRYGPYIFVEAGANLFTTLLVYPIGKLIPNYGAIAMDSYNSSRYCNNNIPFGI